MSAISAVWTSPIHAPAEYLQARMAKAQTIYGPDQTGAWHQGQVALGVNLLHLLPEDAFDQQPLWSADRSACLVADVRLDNRRDLVHDLALKQPEILSDATILLHAWLRWGAACLDHIIGAFAFAVWRPQQQELFAARDHAGDRPLFYHRSEGLFALASMPKGLLVLPRVHRGFNEKRVAESLVYVAPEIDQSLFEGISRLPPGHLLRVTPATFETRRYWHPSDAKPTHFKHDSDYAEALVDIFDRATEARLRSSKGIGAQLSAGLDSSSVTASAAHLLGARHQRLTAFTAVPRPDYDGRKLPWQIVDEGPGAAEVAAHYANIDHVLIDSRGHDLVGTMKTWANALDEPPVNPTNLLWYVAILEQAKQRGIGVLLEGTAGNATISWESWSILRLFFRRGRWAKLIGTASSLRRHGDISIKAAVASSLQGLVPIWISRRMQAGLEGMDLTFSMTPAALIKKYDLRARVADENLRPPSSLEAERAGFFDGMDPGPTHAALHALGGIDFRDPTADKRVFEFCYSIPPEQFVVDGHARSLVRRAMKKRLPEATLARYRRGLQSADWYLPMTEALPDLQAELRLLQQSPAAQHFLDLPRMQHLLDTWPRDGFETKEVSSLWHLALSRGLSLGYFLRSHEPDLPAQ